MTASNGTLINVAEWISRGCDPADRHAPTIEQLERLERDNLLASIDRFGGTPTWTLTSSGMYERERLLAVRYPDQGDGAAIRGRFEWDTKDDVLTVTGTFHQLHQFRAIDDDTRIEDTARSFKASGDEVVVLVKFGRGSHSTDRVTRAIADLERALGQIPEPRWMA